MSEMTAAEVMEAEAGAGPGAQEPPAPRPFLDGFSDEETRAYIARKGFKDVDALGRSFASLERRMSGEGGRIALPVDAADEEGHARIFAALGRPETAEGYGFGELAGADAAFAAEAAGWLFEAGVGKARAEALAGKWNAYVAARAEAAEREQAARDEADWQGLRDDLGPMFEPTLDQFRRGARTFGLSREEMAAIEGGLGARRTIELFARVGEALSEDRFVASEGQAGFGLTREQAESRIAALQRDQAWQARWMSGGADERAEWARLTRLAGG